MKKIVLSTLTALTLSTVALSASDIQLYTDANGQVFTKPAEGRTLLEAPKHKTSWFSHADKLKFSSLAYAGYKYTNYKQDNKPQDSKFELRRAYFQVKAYLLDDPKSYYRITLDATTHNNDDAASGNEYQAVIVKYAYLYLNNILPNTGVELGQVHRPWIDYEEHNSWFHRSIQKVFVEDHNSAHLTNSADLGVNFKTKTKYFDSEIGIFQGEGYHDSQVSNGMSLEWRATAHILGVNGKDKATSKTYWDVSFFGQYNMKHKKETIAGQTKYSDLVFGGLHTVYNTPSFQIAAQYVKSLDTADNSTYISAQAGSGYNAHAIGRFGSDYQYSVIARYDTWTKDKLNSVDELDQSTTTLGFAWKQNKNLTWLANVEIKNNEEAFGSVDTEDSTSALITAQVEF
ncbi:MAG: hypothetical protein GXO30_04510 [Epsilonproteobacteria bacterium]|nr:hypothetical protein [Campylobacterota bacterium]